MKFLPKSQVTINITTETIVKALALGVAAFLILSFVGNVSHQLRLIVISLFLALALNPAVTWITNRLKSRSRVRATGVAYITVLAVLAGFLNIVVPPLIQQTTDFVREIPQTLNNFKTQDSAVAKTVRRYNLDDQLEKVSRDFSNKVSNDFTAPALGAANRVIGTLVSIITIFVLTFMMLIEGPVWFERIMAMQPVAKRKHRRKTAQRMYRVITGYVNGQVLIAAIAALFALVAILIGTAVFNVSVNAVALAGIIFMFGLIPLIGNTIGAAIVILAILFTSAPLALVIAIYFLLYQQIENATLQPYIQSRSNQLTPLIVFTAALLGAGFGGLLGAFAAIPVAGCLRILLEGRFSALFPPADTPDTPAKAE